MTDPQMNPRKAAELAYELLTATYIDIASGNESTLSDASMNRSMEEIGDIEAAALTLGGMSTLAMLLISMVNKSTGQDTPTTLRELRKIIDDISDDPTGSWAHGLKGSS